MPDLSPYMLAVGALWYVVFLLSTVVHEAAHALAAKLGGDNTASMGGQVTLDPRPHLKREPFGMVVVPILSFLLGGFMMGWASAPYDPAWANRYPRRAAWMALAGPGANLGLVLLSGILIRVGVAAGYLNIPDSVGMLTVATASVEGVWTSVAMFLSASFMLNLILGFFNLLPVPPLDGSSGITLLMSPGMAYKWKSIIHQPVFSLIGLLLAWNLFGPLFAPVRRMAVALLYPEFYQF